MFKMDSNYDFDAPQFLDLRDRVVDSDDQFFDCKTNENMHQSINEANDGKRVAFTNDDKENVPGQKYSLGHRLHTPKMKNWPSVADSSANDDEDALLQQIQSLHIDSSKKLASARKSLKTFDGITLLPMSEKKHKMMTRSDSLSRTPLLCLRSRSIVRPIESEDETDDTLITSTTECSEMDSFYKRPAQDDSETEMQPEKFVALAEQVAKFHKDTPDRFRTKPKKPWKPTFYVPSAIIPQSPKLSCASRSRPSCFPDRQQREQQEYEEMLKNQIKANPLNERILTHVTLGLKAPIEKKSTTLPQPFHFAHYPKPKKVEISQPVFKFKAQPVPTRILQSPAGIPPRKIIPPTTPKTPAITMPVRVKAPTPKPQLNSASSTDSVVRNTKVEPFSFAERDRLMLAHKAERTKMILEKERKSFSSFKAQPIRKLSAKAGTPMKMQFEPKKTTTPMPFNLTQVKPKTEKKEPEIQFKANPARVLVKRPFFPTHPAPLDLKFQEFDFKLTNRVEERKKFNEKLCIAQEEQRKALELAREKEVKKQEEELKELRRLAEFKARPILKPKAFEIHSSATKLTSPHSPAFHLRKGAKNP